MGKRNWRNTTAAEKLAMVDTLLDAIDEPYIFCCQHRGDKIAIRATSSMHTKDYCDMLAGFMIATAKMNNVTPIRLLSAVGESMEEIMSREECKGTQKDNPRSPEAAE
ncbi:MAG: hypothetical protein SR1Q5_03240 [Quinella sp. 1Q5]|nr:hypothetical protein [Quinella sp. 1Q5]